LSRARRWLVQLGFEPSQIEVHTDGIPRIALAIEPGRFAEVELVINAVELTDPRGWPSFWDLAQQAHVYPDSTEPVATERAELHQAHATVIGWHPLDPDRHEARAGTQFWDVSA
jgi:hypothetical protein